MSNWIFSCSATTAAGWRSEETYFIIVDKDDNNVLPQTVNSLPPSSNTRVWSFIGFILTIICFLITFIILTQVVKYLPSIRPDERINQRTLQEYGYFRSNTCIFLQQRLLTPVEWKDQKERSNQVTKVWQLQNWRCSDFQQPVDLSYKYVSF